MTALPTAPGPPLLRTTPRALPSVSFLVKRVISVRCGNRPLQSEPNVSETYNPKRKLRTISEIEGTGDTSVTTGEHLTKGKRRRLADPRFDHVQLFAGMDIKVGRRSIQIKYRRDIRRADPLVSYR
jgi:hypothetical protein